MRALWTLTKVLLALAVGIPIAIIALSVVFGVMGAIVGLAILALRIAIVGLVVWGVFRLAVALFGGAPRRSKPRAAELPEPVDPYVEIATRELDRELGIR